MNIIKELRGVAHTIHIFFESLAANKSYEKEKRNVTDNPYHDKERIHLHFLGRIDETLPDPLQYKPGDVDADLESLDDHPFVVYVKTNEGILFGCLELENMYNSGDQDWILKVRDPQDTENFGIFTRYYLSTYGTKRFLSPEMCWNNKNEEDIEVQVLTAIKLN